MILPRKNGHKGTKTQSIGVRCQPSRRLPNRRLPRPRRFIGQTRHERLFFENEDEYEKDQIRSPAHALSALRSLEGGTPDTGTL
jgi:hypothetical protein